MLTCIFVAGLVLWCLTPAAIKKARAIKDTIKANLKDAVDTYLQTQNSHLVVYKCLEVIEHKINNCTKIDVQRPQPVKYIWSETQG